MSLEVLTESVKEVDIILEQLQLLDDEAIQSQMSLVKIALTAATFKLPETTGEMETQLNLLHLTRINSNLHRILESALGYYALIDQPKGTNEPLIGHSFARELIMKLKEDNVNLTSLKDEIFIHINQ